MTLEMSYCLPRPHFGFDWLTSAKAGGSGRQRRGIKESKKTREEIGLRKPPSASYPTYIPRPSDHTRAFSPDPEIGRFFAILAQSRPPPCILW